MVRDSFCDGRERGSLNTRTADAYEFSFGTQQVNGTTAGQTHTGAQAAHLLVNDLFQTAFISNAAFDTFRHQFVSGVIDVWK